MNGVSKLVAFRLERRSVAAAVFLGTQLDYADVRQLSSIHEKAEASVTGFVNWMISSFGITSAAIEEFENGKEMLRSRLNRTIEETLRSAGASLYKVEKGHLLNSYGYPPLPGRRNVREVVTTIWPILDVRQISPAKLDAIALGLYVQTERLFQH